MRGVAAEEHRVGGEADRKVPTANGFVQDGNDVSKLKEILERERYNGPMPELVGRERMDKAVAAHKDYEAVVTGIVGCAGLPPTVAAINAKKNICLANKGI